MTPPRPNEGIDVEIRKEAIRIIEGHEREYPANAVLAIEELCARVQSETEAVVTKREREKAGKLIGFLISAIKSGERWTPTCDEMKATYESNDAGESR